MRCHYTYDTKVGKVHIPGCWGAVIYGPSHCTCYPFRQDNAENDKMKALRKEIRELEKYNAQLQRIIKNC